jgi:hypothetical protein
MRVLYDESHNQTWTIDPALAVRLSRSTNEAPRYYSYAHVAELVRTRFTGECARLVEGPITRDGIAGADLLIVNHCCRSGHEHVGVGGEAFFSPAEIATLAEAVEKGMGLLVIGEFENDRWGSNVNDLLLRFGLRFNDDLATVEAAAAVRGRHRVSIFETGTLGEHPVARGLRTISYCSGCTLALLDGRAVPVVSSPEGAVLMAAAQAGEGRVVAVGDSDLFAEPFITYNDNRALLVQTLEWLGNGRSAGEIEERPVVHAAETAHDLVAEGLRQDSAPSSGTILELTEDECAHLAALARETAIDPFQSFEAFALEAKLLFHELPKRVRRRLVEFAQKGNVDGGLLIRGFPRDPDLPPTPTRTGEKAGKTTHLSELWLGIVAAALGEPVGYLQEKQGSIFQDVFPTRQNADKLSSESSSILLDFHTEIAFHPFMPDYVLLYGLRQDPERQARTIFASVRRFFHLLTPADRDTLFSDLFLTGVDYSFGNVEERQGAGPLVSVLYGDRLDPFLRYDLDLMAGQSPAARNALQVVRELVNEVKKDVVIEPGSLLVIDNRRCVHARSHFNAYYDGRDRWLQRVSVVRDLQPSAHDRLQNSRVIATDFSNFLSVTSHN